MPRHLASIALALGILSFGTLIVPGAHPAAALETVHIVINEFDQFPISGSQWAELYNPTSATVNIGGWRISTTRFSGPFAFTIPSGTSIPPSGYYVAEFEPFFLELTETLTLRNLINSQVDITPLLSREAADGRAWARYPNGIDTDSASDWRLQPATKGYANSIVAPPITCQVSPPQIQIGSTVTIFGQVTPSRQVQVTLQTKLPADVDWANLTIVTTTSEGSFSRIYEPGSLGITQIRAYLPSDGVYPSAASEVSTVTVIKIQTSLSASVTHPSIVLGQEIATYGQIFPSMQGINLTLTYRKPTGDPVIGYVLTETGGFYNDTSFEPVEAGSWNVTVSWEGDASHTSASSPLIAFEVVAPSIPSFVGTEWIIGLLVSVVTAAVMVAAAVTRKARPPKPPRRVALCPACGSPAVYAPTEQRWYCQKCRKYL